MTSTKCNYLPDTSPPIAAQLGVRASTYEGEGKGHDAVHGNKYSSIFKLSL